MYVRKPPSRDIPRVAFVVAAAGSGKSHYAKDHPECEDGDVIISRAQGWPLAPQWWKQPFADEVHMANFSALTAHAVMSRKPILFAGKLVERANTMVCLVEIGSVEIARNATLRPGFRSATSTEEIRKGQAHQRHALKIVYPGLKIYTSFADAVRDAQAYLASDPLFKVAPKKGGPDQKKRGDEGIEVPMDEEKQSEGSGVGTTSRSKTKPADKKGQADDREAGDTEDEE